MDERKINVWLYVSIVLIIYVIVNISVNTNKVCVETKDVVAVVNGDEITEGDVYNAFLDYRGGIIEFLIQDKALEQKAKELGVEITKEDVNNEFQNYKESFAGEEEFREYLKDVNLTENGIKRNIYRELIIDSLRDKLGEDIEISEDEIKERFDYSYESYVNIDIDYVVVNNKDKLDEIYDYVLENGVEGLEDKYKDHIDMINTDEGVRVFDNYFGEYVLNSKVGDVYKRGSDSDDSYLVIIIKDKKETYEDLKDTIREQLVYEISEAKFEELVQGLINDIDVEYK